MFDFRVLFEKDKNREREISNPLEFGFEQPKYLEHKIDAMLKQYVSGNKAHGQKKKNHKSGLEEVLSKSEGILAKCS
jgi:hypothetical protein